MVPAEVSENPPNVKEDTGASAGPTGTEEEDTGATVAPADHSAVSEAETLGSLSVEILWKPAPEEPLHPYGIITIFAISAAGLGDHGARPLVKVKFRKKERRTPAIDCGSSDPLWEDLKLSFFLPGGSGTISFFLLAAKTWTSSERPLGLAELQISRLRPDERYAETLPLEGPWSSATLTAEILWEPGALPEPGAAGDSRLVRPGAAAAGAVVAGVRMRGSVVRHAAESGSSGDPRLARPGTAATGAVVAGVRMRGSVSCHAVDRCLREGA